MKVETAECDSRNTCRIRNLGLNLNFATEQIIEPLCAILCLLLYKRENVRPTIQGWRKD